MYVQTASICTTLCVFQAANISPMQMYSNVISNKIFCFSGSLPSTVAEDATNEIFAVISSDNSQKLYGVCGKLPTTN